MELKYLDSFKYYQILTDCRVCPPVAVTDGWMGVEVGMGVWGMSYACMNMHMHMHKCTHMHVKHDQHGCLHVGGHLKFLYMYTCACVCVHACACMCMSVGTPPCPQMPPDIPSPTCPLPRATGSTKHQISITLELIEIIQFCLKILYLWTFLNSYRL